MHVSMYKERYMCAYMLINRCTYTHMHIHRQEYYSYTNTYVHIYTCILVYRYIYMHSNSNSFQFLISNFWQARLSYAVWVPATSLLLSILWASGWRCFPYFPPDADLQGKLPSHQVTQVSSCLRPNGMPCPSHPGPPGGCNFQPLWVSSGTSPAGSTSVYLLNDTPSATAVLQARVTLHPRWHLPACLSANMPALLSTSRASAHPHLRLPLGSHLYILWFSGFFWELLFDSDSDCVGRSNKLRCNISAPGLWTTASQTQLPLEPRGKP